MGRSTGGCESGDDSSSGRSSRADRRVASFTRPRGGAPADAPEVRHSACQKSAGEESVVFVREGVAPVRGGPLWSLYCLCDGRQGPGAAKYFRANLWAVLAPLLPRRRVKDGDTAGFHQFTGDVRMAVVEAFAVVAKRFRMDEPDDQSGTSVTLAILCGHLLTVANVGDSQAILDLGLKEPVLMTTSHRIDDNEPERRRLVQAGAQLKSAPSALKGRQGGTRCWPGGLAVSRSVGGEAAGRYIVPIPHVYQALLPFTGARIIIGSDGLWNFIHWREAPDVIRRTPATSAATRLVVGAVLLCSGPCSNDASVLVCDVMPPGCASFPAVLQSRAEGPEGGKGRGSRCRRLLTAFLRRDCSSCRPQQSRPTDVELKFVVAADGLELIGDKIEQLDKFDKPDKVDRVLGPRARSGSPESDGASSQSTASGGCGVRCWAPAFLSAQRSSLLARSSMGVRSAGALDWARRLREVPRAPLSGSLGPEDSIRSVASMPAGAARERAPAVASAEGSGRQEGLPNATHEVCNGGLQGEILNRGFQQEALSRGYLQEDLRRRFKPEVSGRETLQGILNGSFRHDGCPPADYLASRESIRSVASVPSTVYESLPEIATAPSAAAEASEPRGLEGSAAAGPQGPPADAPGPPDPIRSVSSMPTALRENLAGSECPIARGSGQSLSAPGDCEVWSIRCKVSAGGGNVIDLLLSSGDLSHAFGCESSTTDGQLLKTAGHSADPVKWEDAKRSSGWEEIASAASQASGPEARSAEPSAPPRPHETTAGFRAEASAKPLTNMYQSRRSLDSLTTSADAGSGGGFSHGANGRIDGIDSRIDEATGFGREADLCCEARGGLVCRRVPSEVLFPVRPTPRTSLAKAGSAELGPQARGLGVFNEDASPAGAAPRSR
ncbi:unnamed protein product [Ostreobium quekettii]|uniref:PPM-type phosphatase domain-containing protein n=1 Tax=Ostreobium quekettii TaxID=121088 RepID=A0A8S1JC36_9CHLO|nr:unnamed protein product [Ostreobium quekettii]